MKQNNPYKRAGIKGLLVLFFLTVALITAGRLNPARANLQDANATNQGPNYWIPYNMGYRFYPTINGNITQLWCFGSGGSTSIVKLYRESDQAVIATASINCTGGSWISTNISPTPVTANTYYRVAQYGSSSYYSIISAPFTANNITITGGAYFTDASYPSYDTGSYTYGQADVTFSTGGSGSSGSGALATAMGSTPRTGDNQPWNYTMGYSFSPNSNGQITKLGGYFNGTKTVTLWNSSGTPLASTSVSCANTWCTQTITPAVPVSSGQTYYVGVYLASSGGAYFYLPNPQTATGLTLNGTVYHTDNTNLALSNYGIQPGIWYGTADVVFSSGGSSLPNLVIDSVVTNKSIYAPSETMYIDITVRNASTTNVASGFYVGGLINGWGTQPSCNAGANFQNYIASLAANSTATYRVNTSAPSTAGTYNTGAYADSTCAITESQEGTAGVTINGDNFLKSANYSVVQPIPVPTIVSIGITDATSTPTNRENAATLFGSFNPNSGANTTAWFRYATTNPGTCNDTFGTRLPASGSAAGPFSDSTVHNYNLATGTVLSANTPYYFCAIANNGTNYGYGSLFGFKTAPPPPASLTPAGTIIAGPSTISWSNTSGQGSLYYDFRLWDKTQNATYTGTCTGAAPTTGDVCYTTPNASTTTYSYTFTAGHNYQIWVHSDNNNGTSPVGGYSNPTIVTGTAIAPSPVICTQSSPPYGQTINTGTLVSLQASGGDGTNFSWTASGSSNPGPVSGASWSGSWATPGTKTANVTSAGITASCTVNVQAPSMGSNSCANLVGVYCYIASADRKSFVIWAQLENTKDRDTTQCLDVSPPDGSGKWNYCVRSD